MNYAAAPIKTTTLNRALMLAALVGVGACGGGDDPANVVTNEKAAACQPSPGDAVHVGLVCLKLDDLFNPAKIAAAKAAYAENAAIVLEGGTLSQLRTALGFPESAPSAESVPAQAPTTTGLPVAPSTDPLASLSTDMAGIALLFDGSVSELEHQSNQMLELFGDAKGAQDALAEWWPTRRLLRPSTAGEGWSQQLSRTHAVSSDAGNLTSVVSTYRLNGKDKLFDYFMVANTMVASAKYGVCDSPFSGRGKIGHYTWLRETFLYNAASSALPTTDITVFETQPGTSVGSNSEGWSIGANLGFNASGPTGGISAGYSQSYSYPNITTARLGREGTRLVGWNYNFPRAQYTPKVCPASETYNSLSLPNALIVQVPKGRSWTAWVFNRNNFLYETYRNDVGIISGWNGNQSNIATSEVYQLTQPRFAVDRVNVGVPANGGTSTFTIEATIPGSQFELSWDIENIPQWMVIDRTSGTGSRTITVRAQPGTPAGSTGYLNLNTLPANGANSVERGPLVVTVVAQ